MARKITGMTVDLGDDQPLVDVDTAVFQLLDELGGRPRMRAALAEIVNFVAREQQPWQVVEMDMHERRIHSLDRTNRMILLEPANSEEATEGEVVR